MRKFTAVLTLVFITLACGPRPSPSPVRGVAKPGVSDATTPVTDETYEPSTNNTTDDDDTDDSSGKLPLRTWATSNEIESAKKIYTDNCSICHSRLDNSTKRGVTLPRLNQACIVTSVPLHTDIVNSGRWPKNTDDKSDDGIDNASLMATALVEALK